MTLSEGQLLHGRYRIEHLVARGGYGAVYKAFDITLNRICAVKENLAAGPQAERQFEQEAQLLARLHHPNLPRVIDHFLLSDRRQYLVMDYVDGRNLQEILRGRPRPLSQDEALHIIGQVCSALTYLHSQTPPIVHRDVKPQNIIVTPSGAVMLVDFGVSKVAAVGAETLAGARGLSSGFSAPEQYGVAPTDARTDVYAVGATLYALLTGHAPADALSRLAQPAMLPPIRQYNGSVSPAVERVIGRALAPAAAQRQSSIAQLERELTAAQSTSKPPRSPRMAAPWLAALAVAGLALAVIFAAGFLRMMGDDAQLSPAGGLAAVVSPAAAARLATPSATPSATQPPAAQAPAQEPTQAPIQPAAAAPTATDAPAPAASPIPLAATSTPVPALTATPTTAPTTAPTTTPTATSAATPTAAPTPFGGGGVIIFDHGPPGGREIYRMAPDGTGQTNLTADAADDWVGSLMLDGRFLLFSSNRSGNWDIYAQDLETGQVSRLTTHEAEDHDPAWSPANNRILFHSDRSDGIWRLYSMDPNGADVRVLTHDPRGSWAGAWSPDGSKVVFSANYPQPGDIYVMNADGSNVANLTNNPAHDSAAHWSPDGKHIVFYSERDGNREIYMMEADGSNPQRLTDDPAADTTPNWSPDGKYIVFASDRQGTMSLYRLDVAAKSVTRLTDDVQADGNPAWAPY